MLSGVVLGLGFRVRVILIKSNLWLLQSVILSGGAINTPQLLMLSGVGPANHLHDHNISVNSDLPGTSFIKHLMHSSGSTS